MCLRLNPTFFFSLHTLRQDERHYSSFSIQQNQNGAFARLPAGSNPSLPARHALDGNAALLRRIQCRATGPGDGRPLWTEPRTSLFEEILRWPSGSAMRGTTPSRLVDPPTPPLNDYYHMLSRLAQQSMYFLLPIVSTNDVAQLAAQTVVYSLYAVSQINCNVI